MKKHFITAVITAMITVFMFSSAAMAASAYVTDESGYLDEVDKNSLEEKCAEYSQACGADFAIVITDDSEMMAAEDYALDFYNRNGYGEDGIILAICMDLREYSIITKGDIVSVFSSSLLNSVYDDIAYYMSDGDFFGAGSIFLDDAAYCIGQYESGAYGETGGPDLAAGLITALVIGFVISLIVALCLKRQLRTRRSQPYAHSYVKEGSFDLKVSHDTFLYSSITKVKVNNSSGGGGGSRSGGGGSRSF